MKTTIFRNMVHHRIHLILTQLVIFVIVGLLISTLWNLNNPLFRKYNLPDNGQLNPSDSPPGKVDSNFEIKRKVHTSEEEAVYDQLSQLLSEDGDFPASVNKLEQESPLLHKYVHFRHLTPPSKLPYNLPGSRQSKYMNGYSYPIELLFNSKKNGTFIEAGAYDGVSASNTLYFEKVFGWKGLLVECNPMTVPFLKLKNRKAWIADVCLSETKYPDMVNFSNPTTWGPSAKIGAPIDLTKFGVKTDWTQFQVPAIPLFALLSTINMKHIDFFSLDVEGAEFHILKTIPWDKVHISAIFMEVHHFSSEVKGEIREFLESKGYSMHQDFNSDQLFVHSSLNLEE